MKVTINGFVHARQVSRYDAETMMYVDKIEYEVFPFDMAEGQNDRVLIGRQEFEAEIPDDFDIRGGMVENLEREKKRITAEFQARVTALNAQIQSLLAIEA